MIKPTKEFLEIFKSTDGALSVAESIAIMNIAAQAPSGLYMEMGTHKGKSAMSAMNGLIGKNRFLLLEPEFNDPLFLNDAETRLELIKSIIGSNISLEFLDEYSTDFIAKHNNYAYVFSDAGSHQDGLPMQEVKLLEDRIVPHGIIAFHDYKSQFIEVEEAYNYLLSTGKYEEINIDWNEIIEYVNENNLEEGNKSWHHNELKNPCFVGALRRK